MTSSASVRRAPSVASMAVAPRDPIAAAKAARRAGSLSNAAISGVLASLATSRKRSLAVYRGGAALAMAETDPQSENASASTASIGTRASRVGSAETARPSAPTAPSPARKPPFAS